MKEKEKALLLNYRYNMQQRLESEVRELQQNLRYRNVDVIDCLELSLALERLSTFNEIIRDVTLLLGLYKSGKENEL